MKTAPSTIRRRARIGLLSLVLVAGTLPLFAGTCTTAGTGLRVFPRGSYIIPMDVCFQNTGDSVKSSGYTSAYCSSPISGNVIRAYGLVYELIRNGVPVYWVIDNGKKTVDAPDMTVQYAGGYPVTSFSWSSNGPGSGVPTTSHSVTYRGGPFVIDAANVSDAQRVMKDYSSQFSSVNVHVSNVAFQGYVAKTMSGGWSAGGSVAPKLALLNIASTGNGTGTQNAEPVIEGYLVKAGLAGTAAAGLATDTGHGQIFDKLTMEDFQPASGGDWKTSKLGKYGYQVLWVPHWVSYGSCSNLNNCGGSQYSDATVAACLATIGSFNAAGNDVFAECAGLGSFDGVFSGGGTSSYDAYYKSGNSLSHFQTSSPYGFWINGWPGGDAASTTAKDGFTSPFMQIGDFPFAATTGAIESYKPNAYQTGVATYISLKDVSGYDVFTIRPAISGGAGTVVYLSGHTYSGTGSSGGSSFFEVAGARLVLNTLFNLGAACVDTGVHCSTGELGVCAEGVMACNADGTAQICKRVTGPSAEVCDGKDNDCNGAVDDGLETECYDGSASTKNVGTCRAGVSVCEQIGTGVYAMSACRNEVLPSAELCNGLDDDCNGKVDDDGAGGSLEGSCYTGGSDTEDAAGNPRGVCKAGVTTCSGGVWGSCQVCTFDVASYRSYIANPTTSPYRSQYESCQILPQTQTCGQDGAVNDSDLDMTCKGSINCACDNGATLSCYDGAATDVIGTSGSKSICRRGTRTCSSGAWGTCAGEVLPTGLDCSSDMDNDCNGTADNLEAACQATCPAAGDPTYTCKVDAAYLVSDTTATRHPICQDGSRTCSGGVFGACTGQIRPSVEVCNGKDDDCNGVDDDGDLCESGFSCVNGLCVPATCGVERYCPDGYECSAGGACVLSTCGGTTCAAGQECKYGSCVDPCEGVTCGTGATCSSGTCTGGGCYTSGCPAGQLCQEGECAADPCTGVSCPSGTFCRQGDCVQSCAFVSCGVGQKCSSYGFCEADPCADVTCGAGKTCDDTGACVTDACASVGCGTGQVCQGGVCADDPCNGVECPVGVCTAGQCYPVHEASDVGPTTHSSGGGCSSTSPDALGLLGLVLLALVPLRRRLRRAPVLLLVLAAAGLGAAGCKGGSSSTDYSACDAAGLATCGDEHCVDLYNDEAHCGLCDSACGSVQTCVDGVCTDGNQIGPYLSGLSPTEAHAGSAGPVTLTLTGQRFAEGAKVRVLSSDGSATFTPSATTATQITVGVDLSDTAASKLRIQVVNPDGVVSNTAVFEVVDPGGQTSGGTDETVTLKVTSVSPTQVDAGATAVLHVVGENFTTGTVCHVRSTLVSDTALPTVAKADGSLDCTLDTSALTPGTFTLWVEAGTDASADAADTIAIRSLTPTLSAVSPSTYEASDYVDLTLSGTNFDRTSVVYIDWSDDALGALALSTRFVSASQLEVPQLSTYGRTTNAVGTLTVHNVGGTSGSKTLTIQAGAIQVSTLSATVGASSSVYQGDTVKLTFGGSGFTGTATVNVVPPSGSAMSAGATIASGSSLSASFSLSGRPEGTYSAYVVFSGGYTSGSFSFRVLSNTATLLGFDTAADAQGVAGVDKTVTLDASNLRGGTTASNYVVRFNGQSLTPSSVTESGGTGKVAVKLPLGGIDTGTYAITLTNPSASTSGPLYFTVNPGTPTLTSVTPSCISQAVAGTVTVVLKGSNFSTSSSIPSLVEYSTTSGTGFGSLVGDLGTQVTVTVKSTTEIDVAVDPASLLAGTTYTDYYLRIRNAGPLYSGEKTIRVRGDVACP